MITDNDIYSHLKNGGSIEELKKAFDKDIEAATLRIKKEEEEQVEKKIKAEKINKAKTAAAKALADFCKETGADYGSEEIETLLCLMQEKNIKFGGLLRSMYNRFPWQRELGIKIFYPDIRSMER